MKQKKNKVNKNLFREFMTWRKESRGKSWGTCLVKVSEMKGMVDMDRKVIISICGDGFEKNTIRKNLYKQIKKNPFTWHLWNSRNVFQEFKCCVYVIKQSEFSVSGLAATISYWFSKRFVNSFRILNILTNGTLCSTPRKNARNVFNNSCYRRQIKQQWPEAKTVFASTCLLLL